MVALARHKIKQQLLEIQIAEREDHEAVTAIVVSIYREHIGEIIDEVCGGLVPDDRLIKIDSLEVDLGRLAMRQLATDFPRAVKKSLSEALLKKIVGKPEYAKKGKINPLHETKSALIYYLSTGLIPWDYNGNLSALKQEFGHTKITHLFDYKVLFKQAAIRKRAVHLFSEVRLFEFIAEVGTTYSKNVLRQFKALRLFLDRLSELNHGKLSGEAKVYVKQLLPGEVAQVEMVQHLLAATVTGSSSQPHLIQLLSPYLRVRKVIALLEDKSVKQLKILDAEDQRSIEDFISKKQLSFEQEFPEKKPEETTRRVEKKVFGDEGLVVNNAGLVLVWPYLQAFFTGLNLMQDNVFLDHQAHLKAVHLLHYLGFGSLVEGNETQWFLNKLLCDLEEGEFVPEKYELTATEKLEGEHLLTAIIKNWAALKNTSPNSLRQTFLQRNGLLERTKQGWTLKVERKAVDVLLERLSWPISVIKLPWNNYIINTVW